MATTKPSSTADRIRALLEQGLSAREVARLVKVSRRYVFQFAERHCLPTNPPIPRNSKIEHALLISLHRDRRPETRQKFNLSEAALAAFEASLTLSGDPR